MLGPAKCCDEDEVGPEESALAGVGEGSLRMGCLYRNLVDEKVAAMCR